MSEKKHVYWIGEVPHTCDLAAIGGTHESIRTEGEFVDGKTRGGPWANMCGRCHSRYGVGLGLGRGQRYTRQADGRWLKTGG